MLTEPAVSASEASSIRASFGMDTSRPAPSFPQYGRRISNSGSYKTIPFDAVEQGLTVRVTEDGHLLALDFLSTLAGGDRKKASQMLARITSRGDFSNLLTLRHVEGKQKTRKLVSFSNAIQLLLTLPKRTVCIETRREVAGVLTDYYEYRHQQKEPTRVENPILPAATGGASLFNPSTFSINTNTTTNPSPFSFNTNTNPAPFSFNGFNTGQFALANTEEERRIAQRKALVDLTHREMELERQRARLPLDRLNQCMELMERCGPMSEEEQRKFKSLIAEQATSAVANAVANG
jgi:hypothetical protein